MHPQLDQPTYRSQIDPNQMLFHVENFLEQCQQGEKIARAFSIPTYNSVESIVICGMGGSAIGGDLIRSYASHWTATPIEVVRNYSLPNYVGPKTLVICSSYSGNTEETLSCFDIAKSRKAQIFAISTGGKLQDLCKLDSIPCLEIPGGLQPRAALGYSFMPLLVFFESQGWIPDQKEAIQSLYEILQEEKNENSFSISSDSCPTKKIALTLQNKFPVIYVGQDTFQPIGARWQAQFNENAKNFAHNFVLPEMNHNEILGWSHPSELIKNFHVLMLMDEDYHPQTKKRFEIVKKLIQSNCAGITVIPSKGKTLLARLFSFLSLGDFISVYLAYLNQQDPTPIPAIDHLKRELAK